MSGDGECEFVAKATRRRADSSTSSSDSDSSDEEFVDCPCGLTDVAGRFMIECPSCRMWQHANCINIWDPLSPVLDSYVCARCTKLENTMFKRLRRDAGKAEFSASFVPFDATASLFAVWASELGRRPVVKDPDTIIATEFVSQRARTSLDVTPGPYKWDSDEDEGGSSSDSSSVSSLASKGTQHSGGRRGTKRGGRGGKATATSGGRGTVEPSLPAPGVVKGSRGGKGGRGRGRGAGRGRVTTVSVEKRQRSPSSSSAASSASSSSHASVPKLKQELKLKQIRATVKRAKSEKVGIPKGHKGVGKRGPGRPPKHKKPDDSQSGAKGKDVAASPGRKSLPPKAPKKHAAPASSSASDSSSESDAPVNKPPIKKTKALKDDGTVKAKPGRKPSKQNVLGAAGSDSDRAPVLLSPRGGKGSRGGRGGRKSLASEPRENTGPKLAPPSHALAEESSSSSGEVPSDDEQQFDLMKQRRKKRCNSAILLDEAAGFGTDLPREARRVIDTSAATPTIAPRSSPAPTLPTSGGVPSSSSRKSSISEPKPAAVKEEVPLPQLLPPSALLSSLPGSVVTPSPPNEAASVPVTQPVSICEDATGAGDSAKSDACPPAHTQPSPVVDAAADVPITTTSSEIVAQVVSDIVTTAIDGNATQADRVTEGVEQPPAVAEPSVPVVESAASQSVLADVKPEKVAKKEKKHHKKKDKDHKHDKVKKRSKGVSDAVDDNAHVEVQPVGNTTSDTVPTVAQGASEPVRAPTPPSQVQDPPTVTVVVAEASTKLGFTLPAPVVAPAAESDDNSSMAHSPSLPPQAAPVHASTSPVDQDADKANRAMKKRKRLSEVDNLMASYLLDSAESPGLPAQPSAPVVEDVLVGLEDSGSLPPDAFRRRNPKRDAQAKFDGPPLPSPDSQVKTPKPKKEKVSTPVPLLEPADVSSEAPPKVASPPPQAAEPQASVSHSSRFLKFTPNRYSFKLPPVEPVAKIGRKAYLMQQHKRRLALSEASLDEEYRFCCPETNAVLADLLSVAGRLLAAKPELKAEIDQAIADNLSTEEFFGAENMQMLEFIRQRDTENPGTSDRQDSGAPAVAR